MSVFIAFEAWSTGGGYTCPLLYAYLWVFKHRNRTVDEIKQLAQQLYAKKKFQKLDDSDSQIAYIDPQTQERRRDEMVPVSYVFGDTERADSRGRVYYWKMKAEVAEYITGRYVMVKLIAAGDSNVDAKFIGLEGYKM